MKSEKLNPHASWQHQPIHCLDFEGSRASGIVEYGLATVADGDVIALETRLCQGTGAIPEMESATHQIRNEDVVSAEPLSSDWEFFRDLRNAGPFAAHHAGVENGLIKTVWPYTTPCLNFISGDKDVDWGPWLDTCALYRALFPGLESYNLAKLIEHFDLVSWLDRLSHRFCPAERNFYHCAGYDALASAVLLLQLDSYEELKCLSLSELLQWSQPGNQNGLQGNQLELL